MKFGASYDYWVTEWQCDYPAMIQKIADCGFDVFEMGAAHLYEMEDAEIDRLKKLGTEAGLEFTVNGGPSADHDFASEKAEVRQRAVEYHKELFQKMDRINARNLIGPLYSAWPCTFANTDKALAWERSLEGLGKISGKAEELGITCSLEVLNRYETYILTDCAEAVQYVEQLNSPSMKILLDTYHMNIEEDNMYEAIRKAGDLLGYVHCGESNRKLPGSTNSIDWKEIGKALREIQYEKYVVMEPFVLAEGSVGRDIKVWRDLSQKATEAKMDENMKKSLSFLKNCCLG